MDLFSYWELSVVFLYHSNIKRLDLKKGLTWPFIKDQYSLLILRFNTNSLLLSVHW